MLNAFPAPQAYMQAPPPGQYPPPPNGAGPRPSMPPTPIPTHAHPYYHQSPQRTAHHLSSPLLTWTAHSKCHSPPSCPVSDDDATARWAKWPARLRWRTCTACAYGRCRPCMMKEIVSHCCLSVFFCFLLGGPALGAQLRAAWLLCTAYMPIGVAWQSLVLTVPLSCIYAILAFIRCASAATFVPPFIPQGHVRKR
jgi:hypothetical protein